MPDRIGGIYSDRRERDLAFGSNPAGLTARRVPALA